MARSTLDNIKVQDVAEVFLVDDANAGDRFFYGCTESTGFNKTVSKELLTCGIGNKQTAVVFSGQSMSIDVQTLFLNPNLIALQTSGLDAFTTGTYNAPKQETLVAVDDGTGGAVVTVTGTPLNDEVTVLDTNNKVYASTFATGTVTITGGVIGDTYIVTYLEEETTAEILDFDADKFPSNVHLQLHTIAYDRDDNIVADLYFDFDKSSPDGALDLGLDKGTNTGTSVTFDILVNDAGSYGKMVVVPRA